MSHVSDDDPRARRRAAFGGDEAFAKYFKERVYATFTGLAIVPVAHGLSELSTPGAPPRARARAHRRSGD